MNVAAATALLAAVLAAAGTACNRSSVETSRGFEVLQRLSLPEAEQAVAVDDEYVYAIGTRVIAKYDRDGGERLRMWKGRKIGPILHLNSGVVRDRRLYAAHSNYPQVPMTSSIETFDTRTLEHVGSHSFGPMLGSATWIDRRDDRWWVNFANYEGREREVVVSRLVRIARTANASVAD